MLKSLGLLAPPPFSGEGGGAGEQINNQSHERDEVSINIPQVQSSGSSQAGEHISCQEGAHPSSVGTDAAALQTFLDLALCASSSVSFNIMNYNPIINWQL